MESHPRTPAAQRLQWYGGTDRGKIRRNNEDSFLGIQFDAKEIHHLGKIGDAPTGDSDYVFAVSDGMGGARAGEFASRLTVDKIARMLPRSFKQAAIGLEAGYAEVLTELFFQIHRALKFLGESDEDCAGMEATLSLCWFTPGWMYFGHIGDSRIYYLPFRDGGIRQISHDDTHIGWLLRQGRINEWEARNHPRRNVLQKALGAGHQFVDPQIGAVAYDPGDTFLICSDGLVEDLYDDQLENLLRSPNPVEAGMNPALRLVHAAMERTGRDNITALVVEAL